MSNMLIMAHRGANTLAPENTAPAFLKGMEQGARGVETDVHLTKDKIPVIHHDYTLERMAHENGEIEDYTLEELKKFDFSKGYNDGFEKTTILTLREGLEIFKDLEMINIELKGPKDHSYELVERVIEVVKDCNLTGKVLLSSFAHELLQRAKEIEPQIKTGLLYPVDMKDTKSNQELFEDYIGYAKRYGAYSLHPWYCIVSEEYVKNCISAGINVFPWTVDDPEVIKNFSDWGVKGAITNLPDLAHKVLYGDSEE